jgi:tetratricopeptide (TPR) repeat protein
MNTAAPVCLNLFLLSAAASVHAQGKEWEKLIEQTMDLYRASHHERAVALARKALDMAEQAMGPDHPSVAVSLNDLALLYRTLGHYAQAEPLYKRALAIWENALGPHHPSVATSLINLAELYRATDRIKAAEEMERRAALIGAIRR